MLLLAPALRIVRWLKPEEAEYKKPPNAVRWGINGDLSGYCAEA